MTSLAPTSDERQPFILCADDFAMTAGVSRAILTLLEHGRLSATCAMTNRPDWAESAPRLREMKGQADLGLHLNLTSGHPCAPMPTLAPNGLLPGMADLARKAATSMAARREIAGEIERQLDAFEARMGFAPDFADGHRHVHVLPGIRQTFLAILQRRYGASAKDATAAAIYVRNPSDRLQAIRQRRLFTVKALVVRALASGMASMARKKGLATNQGFAGFSDFNAASDYANAFRTYVVAPGKRHLVMCHPGHVDAELAALDPVLEARENEFAFLMSDDFTDMLAQSGMRLGRFSEFQA